MSDQPATDPAGSDPPADSPANPTTDATATAIRRASVWCAVALVMIVGVINLCLGRTAAEALRAGIGAAVFELSGWWTYHILSRRSDGMLLIVLIGSLPPFLSDRPIPSFGGIVIGALVMMIVAAAAAASPPLPSAGQPERDR